MNKEASCAESCRDARASCNVPGNSMLAAAIEACNAERRTGAAACAAANPEDDSVRDQCVETVDTDAFICRNVAAEAAAPGAAACAGQYVTCVRACPAA